MYEILLKLKNQTINSIQAVGKQKANSLKEDVIGFSILCLLAIFYLTDESEPSLVIIGYLEVKHLIINKYYTYLNNKIYNFQYQINL